MDLNSKVIVFSPTSLLKKQIQTLVGFHSFVLLNFWYTIGKTFLPTLTWRRSEDTKVVYLTFDDGPHPDITRWVIQELDKVGAKASFFVVGENAQTYPDVLSELEKNGHSIGNHTYHHLKGWGISTAAYIQDIEQCNDVIHEKRLFRPPFGRINFGAIKPLSKEFEIVMWDVLTKDYLKGLNTKKAQKRIQRATKTGSIIVFHDSIKANLNLKVLLPDYLQFLAKEGYEMRAL